MSPILLILFCLSIITDSLGHPTQGRAKRVAPTGDSINQKELFDLQSFLKRIDQLYKRSGKLDTLESYAQVKNAGGGYYFRGYTKVYQYGDFIFILYPDSSAANQEYRRIIGLVKGKMNGPQDWHLETFNKSFSRAGIVLMFANHWIITHPRNCQSDESREVPRENKLFDTFADPGKGFIRIRCEYKNIEMK